MFALWGHMVVLHCTCAEHKAKKVSAPKGPWPDEMTTLVEEALDNWGEDEDPDEEHQKYQSLAPQT